MSALQDPTYTYLFAHIYSNLLCKVKLKVHISEVLSTHNWEQLLYRIQPLSTEISYH